MSKILTISIAAYNMEKYIRDALDSLVDERVIGDLEVFVIDDGGTDRTLEIAKEYAAKYPRSIFPVHKENGGYGTTVNYSIKHATGKYFKLLDGDDWYNTEGLVHLVSMLNETEADVVVMPAYKAEEDSNKLTRFPFYPISDEMAIRIDKMKVNQAFANPNICFKTSVLNASNLELPPHRLYTDMFYVTVPFATAETIQSFSEPVYCYRIGRPGQSTSRESQLKHKKVLIETVLELCHFCKEKKEMRNKNISYIEKRTAAFYRRAMRAILLQPINNETLDELKQFDNEIKALDIDVYRKAQERDGSKTSVLVWLLCITRYLAFWLLKLIPGGMPYMQ